MMWLKIIVSALLLGAVLAQEEQKNEELEVEQNDDSTRGRRDVIEEEKYYNIRADNQPWLPGHTTTTNSYHTTEVITDKPTGRGARASNENWIKLPFPDRDELSNDLQPPKTDLINSRMPRVNFVTQNKPLETSESRSDTTPDDLRTVVRDKPVFPRQALYYPEEHRYYDDRYYVPDDLYRREPYDLYDRRYRLDRYDEYDAPRKPKRIIYYAHLPDVVRPPPDIAPMRYRYDPYRRDDDYYARAGRYDYRFRNRYPYAPLRKEERRFGYRDLAPAGTVAKDKKVDDKVTPTPVLPKKEEKLRADDNANRNNINSHQYHDSSDNFFLNQVNKGFNNGMRSDDSYLRFDGPLFRGTVEDPYQRKY
ncbi:uncharacterized protein LOC121734199 [Aricia agestis]|uniref:uncharacterized protein LOC121734199 n=1 Tax=Aricia agestis TaxID=91739 RepID=UPI001C2015CB|nr:uncharacterized protein LOC121734199 [Aricia agestis]